LIKNTIKTPPVFKHWINDVMHYLTLEQIRYNLQGNNNIKFSNIRQPVLTLIEQMDSNDIV